MDDYKISLGIKLDTSDLQSQVNVAGDKIKPIDIKVDAETKELTKTINEALKSLSKGKKNTLTLDTSKLETSLNDVASTIKEIKTVIGSLDSGSGMKSLLSSVNQISSALEKASNQFDGLNKNLNLLSGKDLSLNFGINLGGSNSVARQGIYGSHVRSETLPELKKQAKALQDYFKEYYNVKDELSAIMKLAPNRGGDIVDLYNPMSGYKSKTEKESLSNQMGAYREYINIIKEAASLRGIDISHITSGFSKSADQLVKDAQDIQTGAKEMDESFEKLKQIFGGGNNLNIEGISAQLDSIVVDLGEIKTALQGLSSGVSLDGLTTSFDRLSTSIENLLANAEKVKGVLNSGFDVNSVGGDINSIKTPITSRKKTTNKNDSYLNSYLSYLNIKGENAKTVKGKFEAFSKVSSRGAGDELYESALGDLVGTIKQLGVVSQKADPQMKEVLNTLRGYNIDVSNKAYKMEYGDSWKSVKDRNKTILANKNSTSRTPVDVAYMELMGRYRTLFPDDIWNEFDQLEKIFEVHNRAKIESKNRRVSVSDLYGNEELRAEVLDVADSLREQARLEQEIAQSSTQSSNIHVQNENKKQREYEETKRRLEEIDREIDEHNVTITDPVKMASIGDADDIQAYMNELDVLEQKKKELESTLKSIEVSDAGLENLENGLKQVETSAESASDSIQQTVNEAKKLDGISIDINDGSVDDDTADTKEFNAELTKLKNLAHQIGQLDFKIVKSDYNDEANQVREFERQLELLKTQYNETLNSLNGKDIDIGSEITKEFVDARNKIAEFEAKVKDTKRKLAEKIKLGLNDGDFNAISKIEADAKQLTGTYPKLTAGIQEVKNALKEMEAAAGTEDEIADVNGLISAHERYEHALRSVQNQLKQNKAIEQQERNSDALETAKQNSLLRLKNLFGENSEAARKFSAEIERIQREINECGNLAGIPNLNRQINNLGLQVKEAGYQTQTFGQKLKKQFSQYSSYLSVASLFMYAEQGLRSMFEQVKLIDSAMTELKKVTNETEESYNKFLTNAADKSREIGTTIDGLVSSTADFARLGYGFEDAQGLAEVANIYAVVGDEIEGVEGATESLISTMAAFKDEMNGMSNTDFAMSIIDKFNEIGNNFSISSGGIGEALERSASSLMAANNTIDESIALITAANTVVQDPEQVGTAFKTISMRMKNPLSSINLVNL